MLGRLTVGGLAWLSIIQMFVVDLIVRLQWASPYKLWHDPISYLGITTCGRFYGQWVCSPWHEASDAAWVAAGGAGLLGAWCNIVFWSSSRFRNVGLFGVGVGSAGTMSVGLNPINERMIAHMLSAGVAVLGGALAVSFLGLAFHRADRYRCWGALGVVFAVLNLAALPLIALAPHAVGALERIAMWPDLFWIMITGGIVLHGTWRGRSLPHPPRRR
ncbi:hypothetical protein [Streptomyces sp. NPDC086787]|uniref:hypothetical protein n=1 Tax=Streptomyces sp. NPDC086787 TaxID=3365759 RepID=UPI00380FD681